MGNDLDAAEKYKEEEKRHRQQREYFGGVAQANKEKEEKSEYHEWRRQDLKETIARDRERRRGQEEMVEKTKEMRKE